MHASRAEFTLNEWTVEDVVPFSRYRLTTRVTNVGGHTARSVSWAFAAYETLSTSDTLTIWKNAIIDPIPSGEGFDLALTEAALVPTSWPIYVPIALGYRDDILDDDFVDFFVLRLISGDQTWSVSHASPNEISGHRLALQNRLRGEVFLARRIE
jgi:hypothetical protein